MESPSGQGFSCLGFSVLLFDWRRGAPDLDSHSPGPPLPLLQQIFPPGWEVCGVTCCSYLGPRLPAPGPVLVTGASDSQSKRQNLFPAATQGPLPQGITCPSPALSGQFWPVGQHSLTLTLPPSQTPVPSPRLHHPSPLGSRLQAAAGTEALCQALLWGT